MNQEWLKLRPFDGDVKNAFEELVCQLARNEIIPGRTKFIRVAPPDGGVESYAILSNGDEHAWQAKFFTSMGTSQWANVEKSFKRALEKHPAIKDYYVCIPLDRADPRIENEAWFMDKWNEKVQEWQAYATSKGISHINIHYWGTSEIFERLSKPENEGKLSFWFNKDEYSDEWFENQLNESVRNLDERYTPEINFELDIVKTFDGLARDANFKKQFLICFDKFIKHFKQAFGHVRDPRADDALAKLRAPLDAFVGQVSGIDFAEFEIVDQGQLTKLLSEASKGLQDLIYQFYRLDDQDKQAKKEKDEYVSDVNKFAWDIDYFRALQNTIQEFVDFIGGDTVTLSNRPFLLITGDAGVGKSHLLADVAMKRLKQEQYTLLLLGQHFTADEPWSQIKNQLHISADRDVFLAGLNAKAEASGSRILIFIDALNEGEGKRIWKDHLPGLLNAISRYQYLGLVLSVRNSYKDLLITDALKKELVIARHVGFLDHEYEASKLFFKNYGIKEPSIPLLHPEFSNPLFLKLFCQGLKNNGLSEIPDGYEGISAILGFYLDATNKKLSGRHNLPVDLKIVQKVAKELAIKIADTNGKYIGYEEGFYFVTSLQAVATVTDKSQFFQDLLSEGLLSKNIFWPERGKHVDGIYFSYERFSDHLIASLLIERHIDKTNPDLAFVADTPLFHLLKDEKSVRYNQGIVEALTIQIPEVFGREVYDLAPHAREYRGVSIAFVDSIVWRKTKTFSEASLPFINEVVIGKHNLYNYFTETILQVAGSPGHFFNADFLHRNLNRFTLSDRDAVWTVLINDKYPQQSYIKTIVDWAWSDENSRGISNESVRLMAKVLLWLLTSVNRKLRDSATKALICLLKHRASVLVGLIPEYADVNDPYVSQRLFAVVYGCAVCNNDRAELKELGDAVFEAIFKDDEVKPDVLLRDYARQVIEYGVHSGVEFSFDLTRIRPPYKSSLPDTFPTNEEIDKFKFSYDAPGFKKQYGSQNSILSSMVTEYGRGTGGYGDFGRYVFEYGFTGWEDNVDINGLSNLGVKWIIEKYGYDVDSHGMFDLSLNYSNSAGRHERIGKKYQWIVFHELLARVADNVEYDDDKYSKKPIKRKYQGPWELAVRDIDPTFTIKGTPDYIESRHWWYTPPKIFWEMENQAWTKVTEDFPDPLGMIAVRDDVGTEWLILEMLPNWSEPPILGEDRENKAHKDMWYQIRSYLIKSADYDATTVQLQGENFFGRWMPESRQDSDTFSREFFWSPAYVGIQRDSHEEIDWDDIVDRKKGKFIGTVACTTLPFAWTREVDESKESSIRFFKPSRLLNEILDLKYSPTEGELLGKDGNVVAFDPGTTHACFSCLVVRKDVLLETLEENSLKMFWTVLGEKRIIGGNSLDRTESNVVSGVISLGANGLTYTPSFFNR